MISSTEHKFVSCFLMGGLGNQLFQICNTINVALNNNREFVFPYSKTLTTGVIRPTYWDSFLQSLMKYTSNDKKILYNYSKYNERGFTYQPINKIPIDTNVLFQGYYQSYKYFQDRNTEIFDLLEIKDKRQKMKEKLNGLFDDNNIVTISMHFRLGDYKFKQEYHPVLGEHYYKEALMQLIQDFYKQKNLSFDSPKQFLVLYFCEHEDLFIVNQMIDRIKNDINLVPIQFLEVDPVYQDWEQMVIMSCCNHNIIANSSFSWWGAYFNDNKNKMVFYPSIWFGDKLNTYNTADLFPPGWKKIRATQANFSISGKHLQ